LIDVPCNDTPPFCNTCHAICNVTSETLQWAFNVVIDLEDCNAIIF